jgi:mono/diheme cytochrome c family protein
MRVLIASLLVLAFLGCRSPRRDEPLAGRFIPPDELAARGQIIFAEKCHQCHPSGSAGLAPAINDKPVPKWLLKTQVRIGLGAMPGFPEHEISQADRQALASYVASLRTHE